jgi:hypothetical protein
MEYILILLSSAFCIPTYTMDAPTSTVPYALEAQRKSEIKRLASYKFDQPELFIKKLREVFKKDANPREYLQWLQILASGLLAQHILMETMTLVSYLNEHFIKSKEQYDRILHRLHAQVTNKDIIIVPETDMQLNILLAHWDIIAKPHILSADEIKTVFIWILDSDKGVWLNNLGLNVKVAHESSEIEALITAPRKKMHNLVLASVTKSTFFEKSNTFVDENLNYLLPRKMYLTTLNNGKIQMLTKKNSHATINAMIQTFLLCIAVYKAGI